MDDNEIRVREIIQEVMDEDIARHKRNGMWIEPVAHFNDHAFREKVRKIRRRSWPFVIGAIVTGLVTIYVNNFYGVHEPHTPHVYIEQPDNPD